MGRTLDMACPECAHKLRVDAANLGKKARCAKCEVVFRLPEAETPRKAEKKAKEPAPRAKEPKPAAEEPKPAAKEPKPAAKEPKPVAQPPSSVDSKPRARSGKAHWLVALTFLPLALMVARPTSTENDLSHRFARTIANATPDVAHKVDRLLHSTNADLDEVLSVLPDDRIEGAYLPRATTRHWLFGAETTILFLVVLPLLFPWTSKRDAPLLLVSLFTATVGVGFVLLAQQVLFARSYALADDPDGNVFSSMLGFTTGVGLCEELAKALPLIGFLLAKKPLDWRTGCLWGLASGVGFGVSEGIIYSSRQYNGLSAGDIYLVRFLSCVALHAIWAASAGIVLCERRKALSEAKSFNGIRWAVLRALAAPMILHAFYDTLLSFDQDLLALCAALGSVAWFATEVSRAEREEGAPAPSLAPRARDVIPRFAA